MNFTVLAPEGTQNHGNPRLICTPPSWKDYFIFFTLNYLLHAVSLPARPGETTKETIFATLNAFFIPGYGATRVLRRLLIRPALIRNNNLAQANAAGALCMVVSERNYERYQDSKIVFDSWLSNMYRGIMNGAEFSQYRRIHGRCVLPAGYRLIFVPVGSPLKPHIRSAALLPVAPAHSREPSLDNRPANYQSQDTQSLLSHAPPPQKKSKFSLSFLTRKDIPHIDPLDDFSPSCEYSITKALFGIFQAVSGILTLYHARGDQLQRYGYSAFSLSVVPYVVMSLINFAATILSPTYQTMYLVHTPDLDSAEQAGGSFDGIVARLDVTHDFAGAPKPFMCWDDNYDNGVLVLNIIGVILPTAIVGILSRFRTGDESTSMQRGWMMSWLVLGSVSNVGSWLLEGALSKDASFWIPLFSTAPLWVPAIGGMVVVGLQMGEYGSCIRIDK